MKCVAVTIFFDAPELSVLENLLQQAGAMSIVLKARHEEGLANEVLEPKPGESPLWEENKLVAYFHLDEDIGRLRKVLLQLDPNISSRIDFDFVDIESNPSSEDLIPVDKMFGNRLHLRSKESKAKTAIPGILDVSELFLTPGLAFGSGRHPTTDLCLEWLATNEMGSKQVLDYGCGSGILGIAATVMGARTICVDYDDQAVSATSDNRDFNDLSTTDLRVFNSSELDYKSYANYFDILVANILAGPLVELAEKLQFMVALNGSLVLSGILESQISWLKDAFDQVSFSEPISKEGWVRLDGLKLSD